jgi:hypothetical protein
MMILPTRCGQMIEAKPAEDLIALSTVIEPARFYLVLGATFRRGASLNPAARVPVQKLSYAMSVGTSNAWLMR